MDRPFIDPTLPQNEPRLLEYLHETIGGTASLNGRPRLLEGGAENRNYSCSVRVDGADLECVLRCEPETIPDWRRDWGLYDLEREFRVLQELPALNIGWPTPRAYGFSDALGVPSFLMERLPGAPLAHEYRPSYEAVLPVYEHGVAAVSPIAAESSPLLIANLNRRTLDSEIAWSEEKSSRFAQERMRNSALSWLREHRPPSRPLVMAHGDPNPSNCLTDGGRITGIVDWEFACLTDDSLGSLLRVTWLYQREDLIPLFCQAMRRDAADLTWHMVSSLLRAVYVQGNQDSQIKARHAATIG